MRNLIIADSQDITRMGIKYLATQMNELMHIHDVADKSALIALLSENTNALVVLDYTLFDLASFDELRILHERYPASDWILFSDELSDSFLMQIQAYGRSFSIILKSSPLDEIEEAIRSSIQSDIYICARIESHIKSLVRSLASVSDYTLTSTEKEILKEIALGRTTKEIAAGRNLSFHTVITHRKNIFRKLDVNNVHEATKYAMKAGIVDLSEYYI